MIHHTGRRTLGMIGAPVVHASCHHCSIPSIRASMFEHLRRGYVAYKWWQEFLISTLSTSWTANRQHVWRVVTSATDQQWWHLANDFLKMYLFYHHLLLIVFHSLHDINNSWYLQTSYTLFTLRWQISSANREWFYDSPSCHDFVIVCSSPQRHLPAYTSSHSSSLPTQWLSTVKLNLQLSNEHFWRVSLYQPRSLSDSSFYRPLQEKSIWLIIKRTASSGGAWPFSWSDTSGLVGDVKHDDQRVSTSLLLSYFATSTVQ